MYRYISYLDMLIKVCKSASACVSALSKFYNSSNAISSAALDTTMTCSNVPTVYSASQMSCSVNQPTLQAIFPGVAELTISRSLNSSRVPGSDRALNQAGIASGTAEAWAQLWLNGIEQFYCHATECNQTITQKSTFNSSLWECTGLACTCRPGSSFCGGGQAAAQNLTGPINGLTGPLLIDCGDGTCQFKQSFLNALFGANGLTLSDCSFGECVEQFVINQAMGIVGHTSTSDGLSGGVIAGLAVVGAIILAIILITIWGLIVRNKARKAVGDAAFEKRGSGVGLAWSGVGYEVKSHGRGLYATTLSWLRGWGSPTTHAHDQEDGSGIGPNGGRIVLRDTRGDLPAGGFCCVLGPSGAGKSTLIDILAGKRKAGRVEGKVAYIHDGHQRVKVGYCDQSDVLSPTATVLETLQFAAYLRLPENIPKAVKDERALQVLHELGLEHIAQTRVGSGEHRGISGGEMRRVSIGVELVADPDVLVLDEPTSGLDSVSAARIVSLLKALAEEHRTTIIASIHQPSSALYHSFAQVLLLANGRQLYFGPGGSVPADFFAKYGYPCPPGYNVADHLIEIATENPQGLPTGADAALSTRPPIDSYASDNSHKAEQDGNIPLKTLSRMSNEFDLAQIQQASTERKWWPTSHPATTFLTQLGVLATREWRMLMRDKTLLLTHVLISAIIGVFAGGLYFNVNLTIAGFQNRVGSLFFLGALISFTSLSALNNMVEMRPLFLRERSGDYYSPQAWLVSRLLFDVVPLRILPAIIVSVILYFMVGLAHNAANFFKFLLIAVEFAIVMALYNFLLPSVFTHPSVATLLSSAFLLFNLTFAGFFINISNIPPVLRWLRYLAPLGYMLEALTVNEVGSGLMIVDVLQGVPIEISAVPIMQSLFGFVEGHYYRNVLILFGWIAGFLLMLVGTVIYFLREKR
ncbi:uncharacterized protein CcaverHIS019_0308950 [Cutaneotrichosporon cavernicola]|uniref:ABC transporter domain-containing protein n=1 Tax=Cutaneotrichosporon cavernicola TaxID=279322 RepID=A0AA48IBW9_9TREE|nr:uncharacterized protein CcaverHIS019_0308950 [Cutaneotrichosporon cavernicola]BEI90825.1 hypothetical protein CcaverHIS019_0308950 [Cutaneotrichosporon cavernicola]BEI98604.1 hypothetical protein CcaverHIS631_0309030 [Cutaneotrichosporon cavernicola]